MKLNYANFLKIMTVFGKHIAHYDDEVNRGLGEQIDNLKI
jgi:hypothetical protein